MNSKYNLGSILIFILLHISDSSISSDISGRDIPTNLYEEFNCENGGCYVKFIGKIFIQYRPELPVGTEVFVLSENKKSYLVKSEKKYHSVIKMFVKKINGPPKASQQMNDEINEISPSRTKDIHVADSSTLSVDTSGPGLEELENDEDTSLEEEENMPTTAFPDGTEMLDPNIYPSMPSMKTVKPESINPDTSLVFSTKAPNDDKLHTSQPMSNRDKPVSPPVKNATATEQIKNQPESEQNKNERETDKKNNKKTGEGKNSTETNKTNDIKLSDEGKNTTESEENKNINMSTTSFSGESEMSDPNIDKSIQALKTEKPESKIPDTSQVFATQAPHDGKSYTSQPIDNGYNPMSPPVKNASTAEQNINQTKSEQNNNKTEEEQNTNKTESE